MSRFSFRRPGRKPVRPGIEVLEDRTVPSVSITGQVFHADGAATPAGTPPDPGVPGVTVFLDANGDGKLDAGETSTRTDSGGAYSFTGLAAGGYTVAVRLPPGMLGFGAQSLSYRLTLPDGATFPNLNFALTGQAEALVRNLFERVLVRPPDLHAQTVLAGRLSAGTASGGQLLASILNSSEFRTTVAPLAKMLAAFFPGRPVDPDLLRANVQLLREGITLDAAILNVMDSQTFVSAFGDTSANALDDKAFVRFAYRHLLHRSPSPAEQSALVQALTRGSLNRGQVVLQLVNGAAFTQANPGLDKGVTVSMAYLGLLGRPADQTGFLDSVRFLNRGGTVAALGNRLLSTPEFRSMKGFPDLFLSDVRVQQAKPAVNVLSRLAMFDPATGLFDEPVGPQSLTGLTQVGSNREPANVYFIAHGWAPGYAEDVALHSTPGDPLKVWQTLQHPGGLSSPGPDSPWLFNGVDQVSAEGFARAVVNADPDAVVIAYSWIDDSGTAGAGPVSLKNPTPLLLGGQSEAYTQLNGLRLADAVQEALGPTFFTNRGLIHLIGHSHGAKVAAVATLALQQAGVAVSQLTTLESPESGPAFLNGHVPGVIGAENFLWYYLQRLRLSDEPVGPNRVPVRGSDGRAATFVDNYFSLTGFGEPVGGYPALGSVVDVGLKSEVLYPPPTDPTARDFARELAAALFGAHDYAPPWYAQASLETLGQTPGAGLSWSPLIIPNSAPGGGLYSQTWTSNTFNQQFTVSGPFVPPLTLPSFMPLRYATQYTVGRVADGGGSITLGGRGSDPLSLLAMSFTPLSATGTSAPVGTGLEFTVQFSNARPDDRLVFWARGDVGVRSASLPGVNGGELGYQSIPLFVMDAGAAGAAAQQATVSLDPFATNQNIPLQGVLSATRAPVFGFSLLRSPGSTGTVTVSNLRQFVDGTPP